MADEFLKNSYSKVVVVFNKFCNHILYSENKSMEVLVADAALSTAVGGMTFPLCLGLLQRGIFRPLRMTSNIRILSSLCGSMSVVIAGSTSSLAFLTSIFLLKEIKRTPREANAEKHLHRTVPTAISSKEIPLYGVSSLVVFKLLAGRFKSVLPSSLIHPGAFARRSIPAKGKNYASTGVKSKLALMGESLVFLG